MPVGLTSQISIRLQTTVDDFRFAEESARKREIEALEAANFALRDQITRVKVHNATLGRMLKERERSPGGSAGVSSVD
jgi:hypothetical protein